ncbi:MULTISPECIES: aminoglycoside 6-adenylyltransferase [Pontibacillus]|uniref:Aminoglycoside 6-adenylyltransferase n=1 Tax=Pontibacillus chungwhensis TaxID=265426 RepID=A0ABY8V0D3_9BACI|nr:MULTISPECIES: aminoglycoside 6-adenylyltransferase [Pontibacillus]MCD5324640.1 aminoglycoside 6-adenylyltransferase [Pontibacillus sp. HN14]WIF99065.1 aminoglycoside 6-adenylyltransferase [Pontibacillus chungwhensis]
MRSYEEMMALILGRAEEDEAIRLVELNGSRANPWAEEDRFQDYDIVYYVEELEPFLHDPSWIDVFGERIIMQMPDLNDGPPRDGKWKRFAYLMLFEDGNRIDLSLVSLDHLDSHLQNKDYRKILLDKDNRIQRSVDTVSDPFLIQKPTQQDFDRCVNEFWWVSTYVAKGLWREELTLSKYLMEEPVRDMLIRMLSYKVGIRTNFLVGAGKGGKDLQKYLEKDEWTQLVHTYPDGDYENMWQGLFRMCDLFEETSEEVAEELGFTISTEGQRVRPYLERVHNLPKKGSQS